MTEPEQTNLQRVADDFHSMHRACASEAERFKRGSTDWLKWYAKSDTYLECARKITKTFPEIK